MTARELLEALSRPEAYPEPVTAVEVRQTHVSLVFLTDAHVWKVKKAVDLGFLDFRDLDRRRHFCEEEVRLNRRLAPSVYLGVVPITRDGDTVRVGGGGEVVDWAVKMCRLPDDRCLEALLARGAADAATVERVARRLAVFHAAAEPVGALAAFARAGCLAGHFRDNLAAADRFVSRAERDRLEERFAATLRRLGPLIDERAARGVPRDTHGDLRTEHVYLFPERPPPDDLAVIDCVEFAERFRAADPVADIAFLVMDLAFRGRRDLAAACAAAWFAERGDEEGRPLLQPYVAYRAAVRAKVEGIKAAEAEVTAPERAAARDRARAHWLLALGELGASGGR